MRLDCGRGKSCYLGKIGSTFSANFDPNTGEYVMTTQSQFVIADNPKNLPCLGAPSNTFVPGRRVVTQSVTDSTDADLMVTDLNQFGITGLPNVGQSWVVTCQKGADYDPTDPVNKPGNRVYIQSLDDPTVYYVLLMQENFVPIPSDLGGSSGAQWQFGSELFCAYNDPNTSPPPYDGGVWDLSLTSIVLDVFGPNTGTIEVTRVSNSAKTNSNDGLNCIKGDNPFTTTTV